MTTVFLVALYLAMFRNPTWMGQSSIVGMILLTIPALIYIGGPISLHHKHRTWLEPKFQPVNIDSPETPSEFREYFVRSSEDLELLGFTHERTFESIQFNTQTTAFASLFRNRKTAEVAKLMTIIAKIKVTRKVTSLAVLSTTFADGTKVVTANMTALRHLPPKNPPFYGKNFPQVGDVDHLLIIHRRLCRRFTPGGIPIDLIANDPDAYLRKVDHDRALTYSVECGYAYNDESAGVQRLTWKGAILSAWKISPPFKQIRLALERRRANRLLRELEDEREFA